MSSSSKPVDAPLTDLTVVPRVQYGVATRWPSRPDEEQVNICGSRVSALKYQSKTMSRDEQPLVADIVKRDVLMVYGPWADE